ncbi:MAG: hypothetical protein ACKVRO_10380 [Micropepsaceae bacterium]
MTVIHWKTRHPERHENASARETQRLAQKVVTGRAGKDILMPRAREAAASGRHDGWVQVLNALELDDVDVSPLRIWGTTKDKSEIDRMCARARGRGSRLASRPFGKRTGPA